MPILRRALGQAASDASAARRDHAAVELGRGRRAPARPQPGRQGRGRAGDRAVRHLVPAAGEGRVRRRAGQRTRYGALTTVLRPASVLPGDDPAAPDYDDGWWGFVSKDLRDLFARKHVRGRWSRVYCGKGKRTKCRVALQASLREALATVDPATLYGRGDCANDPDAQCFDRNRSTIAGAISVPPVAVPEPPDVPADGRGDATPAALTGSQCSCGHRYADSFWWRRRRCRTRTSSARSS